MYKPEQDAALSKIAKAAESDQNVEALYLFGSWDTENADSWSDLDLMAIVNETTLHWPPELGPLFAQDQKSDARGDLYKLVYSTFYVENVDSTGLTLADFYKEGMDTEKWINIQKDLEVRANRSFRLTELNDDGEPITSPWSLIPNRFMQ